MIDHTERGIDKSIEDRLNRTFILFSRDYLVESELYKSV